jgi:hypothetical protein
MCLWTSSRASSPPSGLWRGSSRDVRATETQRRRDSSCGDLYEGPLQTRSPRNVCSVPLCLIGSYVTRDLATLLGRVGWSSAPSSERGQKITEHFALRRAAPSWHCACSIEEQTGAVLQIARRLSGDRQASERDGSLFFFTRVAAPPAPAPLLRAGLCR